MLPKRVLTGLGFAITIPLALLVLARVVRVEDSPLVIAWEAVIPIALLPAYIVFAFAIGWRRRILAVLSAALIFTHLLWVLPELSGEVTTPNVAGLPHLSIFSHNVEFDNPTPERLGDAILATKPDVVFIQELNKRTMDAMTKSGALAAFPYSKTYPAGADGLGIWSRYPLQDVTFIESAGFPSMHADITVDGTPLRLWNIHTLAPASSPALWRADLRQIRRELDAEQGNVFMAGDFNATYQHRLYRSLLDDRYHDAHIALGRGYAHTWPMDRLGGEHFEGYVRLDHVIVSTGVIPTHIEEADNGGSDHRATVTDLALQR